MADKNNAVCAICGKGYHMCLSCKEMMDLSPWKLHTDTSEHYKIYQILRGVSIGVYTNDEAKEKLQQVDLTDLESYREHIKNRIKGILNDTNTVSDVNNKPSKSSRKRKSNKVLGTE